MAASLFFFFYAVLPYALWRIGKRHQWQAIPWREYFGFCPPPPPDKKVLWFHTVSVGEAAAAQPLLEHAAQNADIQLYLTCTTAAARARLQKTFPNAIVSALPLDIPFAVRRFYHRVSPAAGVIVEAEYWINLLLFAKKFSVPLLLANGRLSAASARRYRRISALFKPALGAFHTVLAQTPRDAGRLRCFAGVPVECVGNLKFDRAPTSPPEASRLSPKPTVLLASTREGEEKILLAAMDDDFLSRHFLLIAPRYAHRAAEIDAMLQRRGIRAAWRSRNDALDAEGVSCLIADTMGEMNRWYAACDAAIIGGSFVDYGGQNPIEAMLAGVPAIIGPYHRNYQALVRQAAAAGALHSSVSASDAVQTAQSLRDGQARARVRAAQQRFCARHRGASARHNQMICAILSSGGKPH